MIKVRIADLPGVRPFSRNVGQIIVTDRKAHKRQVIKSEDVEYEFVFESVQGIGQLIVLEGAPKKAGPEVLVPIPLALFLIFVGAALHALAAL